MLEPLDRLARAQPPARIVAAALVLLVLVATLDRATGAELSLSILYLAPVALATWYAGEAAGVALALLAGLAWLVADLSAGQRVGQPLLIAWDTLMRIALLVIVADLLAALNAQLAAARRLARLDSLTGIANRRAFDEQLQHSLGLAARDGQPLSLAYIDVDDLKRLNDHDGHDAGDRALTAVGRTLAESMRRTDTVARLGGDEFAMLLPNTDLAGAQSVIDKARRALEAAFAAKRLAVTCSIGTVTFVGPPASAAEALRAADDLMYEVKARGKNGVAFEQRGGLGDYKHG
jgi:diguanylate cyclase (GGDEF)-like protein